MDANVAKTAGALAAAIDSNNAMIAAITQLQSKQDVISSSVLTIFDTTSGNSSVPLPAFSADESRQLFTLALQILQARVTADSATLAAM